MLYLDRETFEQFSPDGPMGIVLDGEVPAWVGTTVYSMPAHCRNEIYEKYQKEYGISFFFDDKPFSKPDFYAVPWGEIIAEDGNGGWFCTVGSSFYLNEKSPICYIASDSKCLHAAQSGREFIERASEMAVIFRTL